MTWLGRSTEKTASVLAPGFAIAMPSIEKIQNDVEHSIPIRWGMESPPIIYAKPFTFVYGLYSRHGYFYPPYNVIPDVNYGELLQNVL